MPPRPPVYVPPRPGGRPAPRERKTARRSGDENRPNSYRRGYDRNWNRLRKRHLADNPYCVRCLAGGIVELATDVDHVVPIEEAPERRLDETNLQSLCETHHRSAKQREDRARKRAIRGEDFP